MRLKFTKRLFATLPVMGLALILAACSTKSDVLPSSNMTDDEMVTLIWSLPYHLTLEIEHKIDNILEKNPDLTSEEEKAFVKQLLAEQMVKLPENERAALQQKLREDSESQNQ